ncbi:cupin domain-containing protein [Halovivax gelatinilyticus]|uniref:cupin domain-containing protein n=1 Tax=Halovivax gelatinilyticus TaxID=2961597 RepID=UPI0020CA2D59|nr:cupin domain-containing protein [Halovivax gelatinilyticus]
MGYDTASKSDVESVVPDEVGGMWFLKDTLDAAHLGLTIFELEPGQAGKPHDETDSGQEEIYYVVEGTVDVELADETVRLHREEAIRLDPDERRQIENAGDDRATFVLIGAPL